MKQFTLDLEKNKKEVLIAAAVLGVAAFAGYLYFLFIPQAASAFSSLAEIAKVRADVARTERDIAERAKYERELAGYGEKLDRYIKMLPVEAEVPSLLEMLSAMARDANVRIAGITPVMGKETEGQKGRIYQEMPIQLNARSGFHELGHFIASVEASDRFMKVVDIEIKADRASPKRHVVDLVLLTYVLSQGKR